MSGFNKGQLNTILDSVEREAFRLTDKTDKLLLKSPLKRLPHDTKRGTRRTRKRIFGIVRGYTNFVNDNIGKLL